MDVTCLNSIEEAIAHSCEVHRHYSSGFGMMIYQMVEPTQNITLTKELEAKDFATRKIEISLFDYKSKVIEYRDFYKCFTDKLMAIELSIDDFNELHSLIHRNDCDSKDNFPSPRLRELISSITDTLINASFDYFSGIKIFSLKNEIIAFADYPVIKPIVESFNPIEGKAVENFGYFLRKPSYCLRFRAAKIPQV